MSGFETGITGIIGPNGSGKSTILEAIAWALYGMPAARGTRTVMDGLLTSRRDWRKRLRRAPDARKSQFTKPSRGSWSA